MAGPLAAFRIGYGLLLLYHFATWWTRAGYYEDPMYLRFPFQGLEWWPVLPASVLKLLVLAGVLGSTMIALGLFFRYACLAAASIYGYLFLLDSFYFNNHYYLLILMGLLLACTDADRVWAVRRKKSTAYVPYWNYLILQAQLCIVYFYGGLAKMNTDWMSGRVISFIADHPLQQLVLTWGGLFFDLLIGFLLLWRKTRLVAIGLVIAFNVSNHFIFGDIAAFPLLALLGLLLFLEGKFWGSQYFGSWIVVAKKSKLKKPMQGAMQFVLIVFFVFQLLFPLRHYFIPGHAEWTGQGHYFSWRMKSFHKQVELTMFAFDRANQKALYPINTGLDDYRVQRIGSMPHQVNYFARHLKKKLDNLDGADENIGISADYQVSLNARPMAAAILPSSDLTNEKYRLFGKNDWIESLNKHD